MRISRQTVFVVMLALPGMVNAQVKSPAVSTDVPNTAPVFTKVAVSDIAAMAGTSLSPTAEYQGFGCGSDGCIVARAAEGGQPVISMHLRGGKVRATEFRTGIVISHGVNHSLNVVLNGASFIELQCNGVLQAMPNYAALGASNAGFGWQLYDGAKLLNSGHSAGEAVKFDVMAHTAVSAPMELAISDRGVLEIVHGANRIVLTPDDREGIGAKTNGYVTFEDIGLRVAGPAEFAVVNSMLKLDGRAQ